MIVHLYIASLIEMYINTRVTKRGTAAMSLTGEKKKSKLSLGKYHLMLKGMLSKLV
jgi:hypothetical protein